MIHPLLNLFFDHPAHAGILETLKQKDSPLQWKGITASAIALHIASLEKLTGMPQFVVANEHQDGIDMLGDLENLLGEKEMAFYKKSVLFFPDPVEKNAFREFEKIDANSVLLRTEVLKRLSAENRPVIIVTYPEAISEKVVTNEFLNENTFRLKRGDKVDLDFVTDFLVEYAFERVEFVVMPGQFSIRGGIVDVFSFSNDYPYRIEFLGDEVGSIRSYDPANQLSKDKLDHITIVPNLHAHKEKKNRKSIVDILPERYILWFGNIDFTIDKLDQLAKSHLKADPEKSGSHDAVTGDMLLNQIKDRRVIEYGSATKPKYPAETVAVSQSPQPAFNKKFELLIKDLQQWTEKGYKNFILSDNPKQIERLKKIFADITDESDIINYTAAMPSVNEGFIDHDLKVVCYTDHQLFERYRRSVSQEGYKRKEAITLKELLSLSPGDFVTHIDHGIGRFDGLETIENNGKKQETVRLIYKDNDLLYVSIHSLHRIARYTGKEGVVPALDKLGSGKWKRVKERTKSKVKDIARDLIKLYAKRLASKGLSFNPDTYLQHELEASFIFEDTPDQITATADVKQDMENPHPMDRLICGDVGFGKTEVAVRAAFKAVSDSKQVALLVPTTILALQHYHTFRERLKEFPCNIDYLNRFRSYKDQKDIIRKLKNGEIDIVIGTHRLVGKDVKFKDLGLLIVDEEQKFGVGVKEKLKQLRIDVDTLTLTATPIPRTLQFSLMGARDLSVINTPPPNRYPVHTELRGFSEDLIREAIQNELSRGGQVFFIHNRIQNIDDVANIIKRIVPGISVAIGHGQMEGDKLERVMMGFIEGNFDVLVSTSIIESGLDIPNANTIIINDAHMYGLSDLHQLRGRVGRSNKRAYCYLITPPLSTISSEARKRLKAVIEFSDLGSGFNIAMRDLDIRGAGNILGAEQSGFISDIGFEMYQKILREAMEELRNSEFPELSDHKPGEKWRPGKECQIETDLEILLPADYVESGSERLLLYRNLDEIDNEEALEKFVDMLRDRFGKLPKPAEDLIDTIRLRWKAANLGFEKLILRNNKLSGYFPETESHPFYQSDDFEKILDYVKNNPRKCAMKEKKGKLNLVIPDVSNIQQALFALDKI